MQNEHKRRQLRAIVAVCVPRITTIVHNCVRLQLLRNVRCNDVRSLASSSQHLSERVPSASEDLIAQIKL